MHGSLVRVRSATGQINVFRGLLHTEQSLPRDVKAKKSSRALTNLMEKSQRVQRWYFELHFQQQWVFNNVRHETTDHKVQLLLLLRCVVDGNTLETFSRDNNRFPERNPCLSSAGLMHEAVSRLDRGVSLTMAFAFEI